MRGKIFIGALLIAGCASEPVAITVKLVTKSCAQGKNPLDRVGSLKFTITGAEMAAIVKTSAIGEGTAAIPLIPPGANRRITVEGISANSAATFSVGNSAFFDIAEEDAGTEIAVFMRMVDQFTPTNGAADPTKCSLLTAARSGHSATLLNDGRVLIVGGYVDTEVTTGIWSREYLDTAEVYDPNTGLFTLVGPLKTKRAFHTATKLKDSGNVMVVGGETKLNDAPGPLQSAELFDVRANAFGKPFLLEGGARSRHTATQDSQGRILFAGGASRLASGNPEPIVDTFATSTAWYDPTAPAATPFKSGPSISKVRVDHAAVLLHTGHMMLIGGWDGTEYLDNSLFFVYRDGQFRDVPDTALNSIRIDRRGALTAVRLPQENASIVIVAGGVGPGDAPGQSVIKKTAQSVDVLLAEVHPISGELAARRAQHCAVPVPNDGVLIIGGRGKDTTTSPETSQLSADVILRSEGSGALTLRAIPPGDMRDPRYQHTCTVLQDGSVLIVGGVKLAVDGTRQVLNTAEVFTPQVLAQ